MNDFYNDFGLKREDILARIAQSLELDQTRRKKMEDTYKTVSDWLDKDNGFFRDLDSDIYAQGSVRIYTTVKPYKGEDFDLDIVLHINNLYSNYTPEQIYNELIRRLREHDTYKRILNPKNRCARLDYAGDFHMDILPGCIITFTNPEKINIPDKKKDDWVSSNPKGFADWYIKKAEMTTAPALENYYTKLYASKTQLKAETEDLPNEHYYTRKPLQRATQLIKRNRDIYFDDKPDYKTSSIILTTLAGQLYNGENTIYETIDNFLNQVSFKINSNKELKVFNPVNPEEEFTDKWNDEPKYFEHFKAFIADFKTKWELLKQDFPNSADVYDKLFGVSTFKDAMVKQTKFLSKFSTDPLTKASGILLSNNIRTDRRGNINQNVGMKNEPHRDFGDI